jgi:hypothetical protein
VYFHLHKSPQATKVFWKNYNILHKRKNKGRNGINNGKRNKKLVKNSKCEKWCTFNFCKCVIRKRTTTTTTTTTFAPPKDSMRNMEEDFCQAIGTRREVEAMLCHL